MGLPLGSTLATMDPVTSYVVGKLSDSVVGRFSKAVIGRWTDHRRQKFLESFVEELRLNGEQPDDLDAFLDEVMGDDSKSAALFDAYRSVCLSRSRTLGPRVIGIVAASVVLGYMEADDRCDNIVRAAESLSDDELIETSCYVLQQWTKAASAESDGVRPTESGGIVMEADRVAVDIGRDYRVYVGPVALSVAYGTWASKLGALDLITTDVKEEQVHYGVSHYVDEPGVEKRIIWSLLVSPEVVELARLVARAGNRGSAEKTDS